MLVLLVFMESLDISNQLNILRPGEMYYQVSESDFVSEFDSSPWYKRYEEVKNDKSIPQLPPHEFMIPEGGVGFQIIMPSKFFFICVCVE